MIATEQTIAIAAPIARVWAFAEDIRGWAGLMPGLVECEVIDADQSRWTLKVGVGALVRTVRVAVTVERWAGPDAVDFRYALEGDPVSGAGTYRARSTGPDATELVLSVQVAGQGPMAPMWEAMGKPLLPKLALGFAEQFRDRVEAMGGDAVQAPASRAGWWRRVVRGLCHLLGINTNDRGDKA